MNIVLNNWFFNFLSKSFLFCFCLMSAVAFSQESEVSDDDVSQVIQEQEQVLEDLGSLLEQVSGRDKKKEQSLFEDFVNMNPFDKKQLIDSIYVTTQNMKTEQEVMFLALIRSALTEELKKSDYANIRIDDEELDIVVEQLTASGNETDEALLERLEEMNELEKLATVFVLQNSEQLILEASMNTEGMGSSSYRAGDAAGKIGVFATAFGGAHAFKHALQVIRTGERYKIAKRSLARAIAAGNNVKKAYAVLLKAPSVHAFRHFSLALIRNAIARAKYGLALVAIPLNKRFFVLTVRWINVKNVSESILAAMNSRARTKFVPAKALGKASFTLLIYAALTSATGVALGLEMFKEAVADPRTSLSDFAVGAKEGYVTRLSSAKKLFGELVASE